MLSTSECSYQLKLAMARLYQGERHIALLEESVEIDTIEYYKIIFDDRERGEISDLVIYKDNGEIIYTNGKGYEKILN